MSNGLAAWVIKALEQRMGQTFSGPSPESKDSPAAPDATGTPGPWH